MNKKLDKLTDISDDILTVFMMIMLILSVANVIARYVFSSSMNFVEEITVAGMVILTYAGSAGNAKTNTHISLTLLYDKVPPTVQKAFDLIGCLLGVFFAYILSYRGTLMLITQINVNQRSGTMGWPQWIYSIWLPIGGVVMLIVYVQMTVNTAIDLFRKKDGKEDKP